MTESQTAAPGDTVDSNAGSWVVARVGASGFRTEITAGGHQLVADEPVGLGGTDAGATPYGILLGALSSCTAMTLRMYADRKKWPLESVVVQLRTARSHERDCEDCETQKVGVGRIERRVDLVGPLSDDQRRRLMEIADRCPVKQSLERGIQVVNAE